MSDTIPLYGFYGFTDYPTSLLRRELDRNGNRRWAYITEPAVEPITVKDVKDWGRIDGTLDDDMIANIISSARKSAETYTGRSFITQTVQMFMDFWPSQVTELIGGPFYAMTSVSILDESGAAVEYDSSQYYILNNGIPPKIVIGNGYAWPQNTLRMYGGYRIEYKVGYGSTASSVPSNIRDAIKLWAIDTYESRVPSTIPPKNVKEILDVFKVIHL